MADEGGSARRDILLAVIIALSVAVALVMDSGLECRVHQGLVRADSRLEAHERARPAAPPAKGSETDSAAGLTSVDESLNGR